MLTLHAEVFQWNSTSPYSHTQITKLAFEVGVLYDLKTLLKPLSSVRGNRFDVFSFHGCAKNKTGVARVRLCFGESLRRIF